MFPGLEGSDHEHLGWARLHALPALARICTPRNLDAIPAWLSNAALPAETSLARFELDGILLADGATDTTPVTNIRVHEAFIIGCAVTDRSERAMPPA